MLNACAGICGFGIDRINFLKVDCEGSEHSIFETLTPELAARIDQIAMEVHEFEGAKVDHLSDRLTTLGFVLRRGTIWFAVSKNGASSWR